MRALAEILDAHRDEEPLRELPRRPQDWVWPAAPETVEIFDKYSGRTIILRLSEHEWNIATTSGTSRVVFSDGELGQLQRRLVLLSRGDASPGVIRRAAATLIQDWSALEAMLTAPIGEVRKTWDERVENTDQATTFKAILKLACLAEVGPWKAAHMPMVKSLDTLANGRARARGTALRARKLLAGVDEQAAIVRFLDSASQTDKLSDLDVEG